MECTTLGRTGLKVSVMGLGCGGHSRLGLATGRTEAEAIAVVRKALELGINFIDTAEGYRTEDVVGQALKETPRERVVLSTKVGPRQQDRLLTAAELVERAEGCLRRLRTDYVDILHLHGVRAEDYAYCVSELVPALQRLRAAGKVRFPGITEVFAADTGHRMLTRAVADDCWDIVMVGYNLLNPSAHARVFPATRQKGIGTLCMFAVRRALSRPEVFAEVVQELIAQGLVEKDALAQIPEAESAARLTDLAYRFCRAAPGIDVVLSGTGNPSHLEANAAVLNAPPLPPARVLALQRLFERVDSVSGN